MGKMLENIRGKLLRGPLATSHKDVMENSGGMPNATSSDATAMEGIST